ncbi:hypothetical protein DFJ77DRAFT_436699 [Powellomyces hirtus]|nr:hypothetical protein DFJ77DRAFT_436699 [Powellomyces hirtus]
MPVPTDNNAPLTDLAQQRMAMGGLSRNRPQMSSRACSYQETSRYRTANPSSTAAPVSSHLSATRGTVTAPAPALVESASTPTRQDDSPAGLVGSENKGPTTAPVSATSRPVLNRGFTRDAWVKQLASGGMGQAPAPTPALPSPRGQGPFAHGYFAGHSSGSGKNTPAAEVVGSVWGPASPSLITAFSFEEDITGTEGAVSPSTKSFAFTVHADRHLSAVSRPGTPTDEAGERIPESVTETAERFQEGLSRVDATPATGRKLMVAVDAADQDGLATLDWACKNVVQLGDTLIVVRIVKELKGFKGGYAAASDMLSTIEKRAREEADRVTCHAIRQLGREGKKCVDLYVKYRVGEPRACIRELVTSLQPRMLVVGNSRQRVAAVALNRTPGPVPASAGNIFFHGGSSTFVPAAMRGDVEVITAQ